MKQQMIIMLLIVSLVTLSFAPGVEAEKLEFELEIERMRMSADELFIAEADGELENKVEIFLKQKIKILPEPAEAIEDNATNYDYFAVQKDKESKEKEVSVNLDQVENFKIYQAGEEIDKVEFLTIMDQIETKEAIEDIRATRESRMNIADGIAGVGAIWIFPLSAIGAEERSEFLLQGALPGLAIMGIGLGVAATAPSVEDELEKFSFREAAELAESHNQDLIQELGLTEDEIKESIANQSHSAVN